MRRGFTLVEVMTVIVMIGILSTLGVYVYASSSARSRDTSRLSDLSLTKNALEQFYLDNRSYPVYEKSTKCWVFNARWQLSHDADNAACPRASNSNRLLAPFYMTAIPEDPLQKVSFNSAGVNSQAGQYLYVSLPDSSGAPNFAASPATSFRLLAKLERSLNQNIPINLFNGSYYGSGISAGNLSFGIGSTYSQNYYLTSGRNN